jgi:hypothetical protein
MPTQAVVDNTEFANAKEMIIFLAAIHKELHQVGHGLVRDVGEVEVPHCLDHISRVGSTLGLRRPLVWESEWEERTVVDDGVSGTALGTALSTTMVAIERSWLLIQASSAFPAIPRRRRNGS